MNGIVAVWIDRNELSGCMFTVQGCEMITEGRRIQTWGFYHRVHESIQFALSHCHISPSDPAS
jgi:hypothetical protein